MELKKSNSKSKPTKKQSNHSMHDLSHHKLSHCLKLIIWSILIFISLILVIYVLATPTIIMPKTLNYHPFFTYFQDEFKINNIHPKRFLRDFFSQKITAGKSYPKKSRVFKQKNFLNIVFGKSTQPAHFDNWLILGDYLSFLANKENILVRKKLMTHSFAELFNQFKFHDQIIKVDTEIKVKNKKAQRNEAAFFRFSDKFQKVLQSQAVYIEELRQNTFFQRVKNLIDGYFIGIHNYFRDNKKVKKIQSNEDGRVWILWLLHLQRESLKGIKKEFQKLKKKYHNDKFIVLSLYPIFSKQGWSINYNHSNRASFKMLIKYYLNSSMIHSTLISQHFEYSLLELSNFVQDEQSFTLQNLVGGRLGYRDLQKIPQWVIDKVERLCRGQISKTSKILLQEQKQHFYRMGIYQLGNEVMWKNKQSRTNYEFQMGKQCKKIPIFHNDYFSMLQTFKKTYFGSLF